jgi:FkbM family methyltransferase
MSPAEITIGVLTYGDYPHLARQAIESIRTHCERAVYRLVVGANAVCDETRHYLESLERSGAIDRLILSDENITKLPMMQRMLEDVSTDLFWWFDDDSYVVSADALPERLRIARTAPPTHVMWGHKFFFSHELDFSCGVDVSGYVRRAPWYRGLDPPSSVNGGDSRWFFITGGCWVIRTEAVRTLGWPDLGLVKRHDDVLLGEAIRQHGWESVDIGPCGTAINTEPRRGRADTVERASLLAWRVAHEMHTDLRGDELVVRDTTAHGYHLLRLHDDRYLYRMVRLRCQVRALPGASTNFYVHHFGHIDVAEIALDGAIINRGICRRLDVARHADGVLQLDLEFLNCHPTLTIGCSKGGNRVYAGDGAEQFAIRAIEIDAADATAELSACPTEARLTLVDVGGQQGLPLPWMLRADRITPVVFEPLPEEAEQLRATLGRIPGGQVVERALADASGTRTLYVTAASSCSSLREPNDELLREYTIAPRLRVVRQLEVDCVRYDQLFAQGVVPQPDVIKIDVQGCEYEALQGFGDLLHSCLGVELEAHLYPVYKGQKLLGDLVALLAGYGLVLRQVRSTGNFDGDCVEVDAFFTQRRDTVAALPDMSKKKFTMLCDAWELPSY